MLMRGLALAFVVGIVGIAGVGTASAWRGRDSSVVSATSSGSVTAVKDPIVSPQGASAVARSTPAAAAPSTPAPAVPTAVAPAPRPAPRGGSTLAQGRTSLTDSVFAVRDGDSVIVNFDTQGNRTRRADKFETMIRTTLPMVYGRLATSTLDSVPTGSLLPSKDLLGALREEGLQLTLDDGTKIRVWTRVRVGRDGPLVVAYRTVVER
jgi:hypothetical protein